MFELRNVTAGYGGTVVLRDISLAVPPSSVVALLGSNGAGKTTLLRVASGLLRPWTGQVVIDGQDLTNSPPHSLVDRGLCHVPEGRGVFPSLTVEENLRLQAAAGGEEEAFELVADVFPRLRERRHQKAGTMSGGEQQMLALARAYVQSPSVVLLDEVSMGLAPLLVDEIFDFLGRLADQGTSLLLVEQYVARALHIADYVYLLERGRLAFSGEPAELDEQAIFERYAGTQMGSDRS